MQTFDETIKNPVNQVRFTGKFTVSGADKVGVLKQVVGYIASQDLAIKTLVTNIQDSPGLGGSKESVPGRGADSFEMKGILATSSRRRTDTPVDVQALLSGFAVLEKELGVSIAFEDRTLMEQP